MTGNDGRRLHEDGGAALLSQDRPVAGAAGAHLGVGRLVLEQALMPLLETRCSCNTQHEIRVSRAWTRDSRPTEHKDCLMLRRCDVTAVTVVSASHTLLR